MLRREFIRQTSSALLVISGGRIITLFNDWDELPGKKRILRFVVASDGHYGQKDTLYESFFEDTVRNINLLHKEDPFDFCVVNGDIIHDEKKWFLPAKDALDKLEVNYYVSQGNHDHATPQEWEDIWKMPVNIDFSIRKSAILIGTTSNEKGTYLCPDLNWFTRKLEAYRKKKNIFIFIHINPGKLTRHAVDCPEFFNLLSHYKNVRAVFNGHDHDEDNIKIKNEVPFIFDSHIGGSWGTAYRGFRIVELRRDNSLLTYILNPSQKLNEQTL